MDGPMKATLCYFTGRREPRLEWFIEAVLAQAKEGDDLEVIVIDALFDQRSEVDARVAEVIGRSQRAGVLLNIRTVAPKPTVWQGPHRITDRDWWAASSGRNTGIVLASCDYIAFIDDRCRPGPAWLDTVRRGYTWRESVIAGSYDKLDGPMDARTKVVDHRRVASPHGTTNCGGGWLYGCTFCLPLEWALEVNGFEEGCDSLTGEDYIFGRMLHNAGRRIDFDPKLYVMLDRDPGDSSMKGKYACTDKGKSPNDKSHAALERFGSRSRTELTPDLRDLRDKLAAGEPWPVPDPGAEHLDWYDGQPIREMRP